MSGADTVERWDGVPQNPERDGWHWLKRKRGGDVSPWEWTEDGNPEGERWWAEEGGEGAPEDFARAFTYHGPCDPTQAATITAQATEIATLRAQVAGGVGAGLEQAARWHDEEARHWDDSHTDAVLLDQPEDHALAMRDAHRNRATALRALIPDATPVGSEREAALREALEMFQQFGCPVCGGDCGAANPPVSPASCPMLVARDALAAAPTSGAEGIK